MTATTTTPRACPWCGGLTTAPARSEVCEAVHAVARGEWPAQDRCHRCGGPATERGRCGSCEATEARV